jgi:hypothetical protein
MKKKFFFGILFSALLAINIMSVFKTELGDLSLTSLMQTAQAGLEYGGECYPWSPNYNPATGKCDIAPSGAIPEEGGECGYWDFSENKWVLLGFHATICTWTVIPSSCPLSLLKK